MNARVSGPNWRPPPSFTPLAPTESDGIEEPPSDLHSLTASEQVRPSMKAILIDI
jgi:hypothetical protein